MRALLLPSLVVATLLAGCGSDVTTFGDGGGSSTDGGGGAGAGTSTMGPGGAGGEGGSGGDGGAGPACEDFGNPCTGCLATSEECADLYCGCLEEPACAGFWQCAGDCNGDAACFDQCELAFSGGYADFFEVRNCMGEACSSDCGGVMPLGSCFNCLLDTCESELEACQGDADCNDYLDCTANCSGIACVTGCYAALPDSSLINALFNCNDAECEAECPGAPCQGFGDTCTDCAASATCSDAYCNCVGSTPCIGLSQCFNGCQANDEACADACEATWFAGYGDYLLMIDCMGTECSTDCSDLAPLNGCLACLAGPCESALEGCLGDADCNEYFDCTQSCTTPGCELTCYDAAPDKTAIDALGACLTSTCSSDCS